MLMRLHAAIAAVCPIDGVSGVPGVVRIDYRPEATSEQRAAAESIVAGWDWDAVSPPQLAPYDFMRLFSAPERLAILQSTDPVIMLARADLQTIITVVDCGHPDTINYVGYLAQQGLIGTARVAQILTGETPQ